MIGYLKGKVIYISNGVAVIDVNNVGYKVEIGNQQILESKEAELFIYTHVRENEISLYGFLDKKNLEVFQMLLSVPGIGPKSALTLTNNLGAGKIFQAISASDVVALQTKGIGKKSSEKIIIELKNKVGHMGYNVSVNAISDFDKSIYLDVFEALSTLGYRKGEIDNALKKIDLSRETSSEVIIKKVLTQLRR